MRLPVRLLLLLLPLLLCALNVAGWWHSVVRGVPLAVHVALLQHCTGVIPLLAANKPPCRAAAPVGGWELPGQWPSARGQPDEEGPQPPEATWAILPLHAEDAADALG